MGARELNPVRAISEFIVAVTTITVNHLFNGPGLRVDTHTLLTGAEVSISHPSP